MIQFATYPARARAFKRLSPLSPRWNGIFHPRVPAQNGAGTATAARPRCARRPPISRTSCIVHPHARNTATAGGDTAHEGLNDDGVVGRTRTAPEPDCRCGPDRVALTCQTVHCPSRAIGGCVAPDHSSASYWLCARQRSSMFVADVSPPSAIRHDVMEFQETGFGAASLLSLKCTTSAVARPHVALDGRGDVARARGRRAATPRPIVAANFVFEGRSAAA